MKKTYYNLHMHQKITVDHNTQESTEKTKTLSVSYLGSIEYSKTEDLQVALQNKRIEETIPDTLLLLEHPYVITLGKRGLSSDILAKQKVLKDNKVTIAKTNRGGQVTIHGPGQLVGYCIFHLYRKQRAIREFIYTIEQALIDTLRAFDIHAEHGTEHSGVWVGHKKIAAIGISIAQGVTRHGFALNVNNNLDSFNWIIPCGIHNGSFTSMEKETNRKIEIKEVCDIFVNTLATNAEYSNIVHNTISL